jgi:hypothetical protein
VVFRFVSAKFVLCNVLCRLRPEFSFGRRLEGVFVYDAFLFGGGGVNSFVIFLKFQVVEATVVFLSLVSA